AAVCEWSGEAPDDGLAVDVLADVLYYVGAAGEGRRRMREPLDTGPGLLARGAGRDLNRPMRHEVHLLFCIPSETGAVPAPLAAPLPQAGRRGQPSARVGGGAAGGGHPADDGLQDLPHPHPGGGAVLGGGEGDPRGAEEVVQGTGADARPHAAQLGAIEVAAESGVGLAAA